MQLNAQQQQIVVDNMGLVGKVIRDRVRGIQTIGTFDYDDLFQIGCIGLIKAVATDKGGCFSTYAYRLIWNEICDALAKATKLRENEQSLDSRDICVQAKEELGDSLQSAELRSVLSDAEQTATKTARLGIRCLKLSAQGYSSQEIGNTLGADPRKVRMWMTRARRHLKTQLEPHTCD